MEYHASKLFVEDIGTQEALGSIGQKRKKKKNKKDGDPRFAPIELIRYANWYEKMEDQFLEYNYLKNTSTRGEIRVNNF